MRLTPIPRHFLSPDSILNPDQPDILFSPYLLIGETQRRLRDWKKRPSRGFEENIKQDQNFKEVIESIREHQFKALLPIPQKFERSLHLAGGPANRIAHILRQELQIPIVSGLISLHSNDLPQGKRMGIHRYSNRREYGWNRDYPVPKKILIVDDFWTSGQTIRSASRSLRRDGCDFVGAFVLGLRPFMSGSESITDEFKT